MRSVVEALRVPRVQRAQLVDHPSVVTSRGIAALGCRLTGVGTRRGGVAEAFVLARALVEQQLDVLEQECAALLVRDVARHFTARHGGRLLENPWVAKRAAPDEDARDAGIVH